MTRWRQRGDISELEPAALERGTLEFIGGSYLAASPQLSYRRLLEALASLAWRRFRQLRGAEEAVLRLGHSLGCKLHLLAPDGGRGSSALVALSFNNFSAERSIPLLAELGQQFNFRSEFSPSPEQTLTQVALTYRQPRNLLVRFNRDQIDQSKRLLGVLQARPDDASELQELPGDHLAPASAGLRQNLLGKWADDPARQQALERIARTIDAWAG